MSWEIILLYFLSRNVIWFLQKELTKAHNLKLSATQIKFHQICILIGFFCWKYIEFKLKSYRGVMSHNTGVWCKIWRFFVIKMTKIWWILIRELKSLKKLHFGWSFYAKYITFDLKKYRGDIFHNNEKSCKIWRKIDVRFGKWHEEFGKFSSEHLKVSKLVLSWDPFPKVEDLWAKNL